MVLPSARQASRAFRKATAWGLLIFQPAGAFAFLQSAAEFCRQAQFLLAGGDFARARQAAESALRTDPRSGRAESLLGAADFALSDLEGASSHSRRALELQPQSVLARRTLGAILLKQRRYSEARSEFEQLLSLQPEDFVSRYSVGLTFLLEGQPAAAATRFEQAAKLKPRNPTLLVSLLQARLRLNERGEATALLAQLDGLLPARDPRRMELAAMLVKEHAYDLAIPEFQQLVKEQPDSYELNYDLALAYYRTGRQVEAAQVINRMPSATGSAETQDLLGEIEQAHGNDRHALTAFQRAAEIEPHNEDYRYDYAQALAQAGVLNQALEAFQRAVEDFPGSARMLLGLSGTRYLAGKYRDAADSLLQAAAAATRDPRVFYLLGRVYDAAGPAQPAIAARFARYLETAPNDAWAHVFYGKILISKDRQRGATDLSAAEGHLLKAIALDANLAEAHLELANLLQARRELSSAREELERTVQLDPKLSAAYYRLAQVYRELGEETLAKRAAGRFQQLKIQEGSERDHDHVQRLLAGAKHN